MSFDEIFDLTAGVYFNFYNYMLLLFNYFALLYFILFYFILFYFILFFIFCILFYFILFYIFRVELLHDIYQSTITTVFCLHTPDVYQNPPILQ